jgi:tRNA pseudouridine synthase 10
MKSTVLLQGIVLCKFCQQRDGLKFETILDSDSCYVCKGMMTALKPLADEIVTTLAQYEFESFLPGASVPQSILDREDELRSRLKIKGRDSIKSQINKILSKRVKLRTGKIVNYSRPDVTILASMVDRQITINPRSIWLRGNYVKLVRGLPQRSSVCNVCGGLGCAQCDFRGKSFVSVQAKITDYLIKKFSAESCNFVWLGSEDENSLVGGSGRPFFVEVTRPKKRSGFDDISRVGRRTKSISFRSKEIQIKNLEVLDRRVTNVPQFGIRARIYLKRKPEGKSMEISQLDTIKERYSSVLASVRLSRKLRTVQREIQEIRGKVLNEGESIELEVRCDGGIPLKKLVLGQDGTVEPNLSEYFGSYEIDREKPFDILEVKIKPARLEHLASTHESEANEENNLSKSDSGSRYD